jgi:hypothetical protein
MQVGDVEVGGVDLSSIESGGTNIRTTSLARVQAHRAALAVRNECVALLLLLMLLLLLLLYTLLPSTLPHRPHHPSSHCTSLAPHQPSRL